ncbi:MAG: hypothetical protein R2688_07745 [Fimbriimonadaceae bacterium]
MIVETSEDVVKLSGALTADFAEVIETAMALTLSRHPGGVIIDCSGLSEMDAKGAKTIQAAIDFVLEHEKARIIFAAVPDHLVEVMKSVPQVRSQMALTSSVEQARQSLHILDEEEEHGKPIKEKHRHHNRQILVCLCPSRYDQGIVDITLDLLSDNHAKVVLLMPIVVPRELPVHAPMPEIEAQAQVFAEKAKSSLRDAKVGYELRLERTRDLPTLVAESAEEVDASHVVVSISPDHAADDDNTKTFHSMLEKVDRPLIFVRAMAESEDEQF